MFFSLGNGLQLDYNKLNDSASLIVAKSGNKLGYIYSIDTIMFHEMLKAIRQVYVKGIGESKTIKSPYVNNNDSITVTHGPDYISVAFQCKVQNLNEDKVIDVVKTFNLKPAFVHTFIRTIIGSTPPSQPPMGKPNENKPNPTV